MKLKRAVMPSGFARKAAFVSLTLVGLIAGAVLERSAADRAVVLAVHAATYLFGSYDALGAIWNALIGRRIEVDLLMVSAAAGAAYLDAWSEGATLLFLFSLSNVLQEYAMGRTQGAISSLMALRPDTVEVKKGEETQKRPIESVAPGEVVVFRPGDRVALDGTIVSGSSDFDEAAVTGESLPCTKSAGSNVVAGTLVQSGVVEVRVAKASSESTLARIIAMVSDAREKKAQFQSLLERWEGRYAAAVMLAVAVYIVAATAAGARPFPQVFYRAMVLMTVASPCALVISVPAALLSAIAGAARHGVLFKGGVFIEALGTIRAVAFDKTGTLSTGTLEVVRVDPADGWSETDVVEAAATAELLSTHPIGRAIVAYAGARGLAPLHPDTFRQITAKGVEARLGSSRIVVGSPRLFDETYGDVPSHLRREVERRNALEGGTTLVVRRDEGWLGTMTVADAPRPDAERTVRDLRLSGIDHVAMLTGDNGTVAQRMAETIGIDAVHAELLPEDKLTEIDSIQRDHGPVAMVGDGINDAPALASARVGIAMGAAGTDVALETADVVLMSDDLSALVRAIAIAKRARRIVLQNVAIAMGVVVTLVVLTFTVGVPLPIGVLSHEGSTIVVVLNGLRLLRRNDREVGADTSMGGRER